jgi:hypothetical protein
MISYPAHANGTSVCQRRERLHATRVPSPLALASRGGGSVGATWVTFLRELSA